MQIIANRVMKRNDGKAHIIVKRMDDTSTSVRVKILVDRKTRKIQNTSIRVFDSTFVKVLEMWQACSNEANGIAG